MSDDTRRRETSPAVPDEAREALAEAERAISQSSDLSPGGPRVAGHGPHRRRGQLAIGCNNVALTWPPSTPISLVARAISPENALEAIWRYVDGRYFAFAPGVPDAVIDYVATSRSLEAVFICMRRAGVLNRPAL